MGEHDAFQAQVLIRTLCDLRNKLVTQLDWLEKHGSALDAASVRRDINEAEGHVDRLRRCLEVDVPALQPLRQAR